MRLSPSSSPNSTSDAIVLQVQGLTTRIGGAVLHRNLDLALRQGEVLAVVGASGSGKSVLLRTLLGLMRPAAGRIEAFGQDLATLDAVGMHRIERRWGVLFQDGALFSSLTVAENVAVPLKEMLGLALPLRDEIAALKVALVGLPPDAGDKYPAELSGGMRKRAGLARALALDPELLFLDEPTSGLDPIAAADFDKLLADLRASLGLTVFMVTHDLDSILAIADRVAVLVDKGLKIGTVDELRADDDPWIARYFGGARGRAAPAPAERAPPAEPARQTENRG
ncbi:MAG TPA: ATP-binding cassette domain-containing protein [Stellaceae bacterium]|nr:ATP-binding cassette domain-containing protein [Stellaceae bacterium]